MWSRRAARGVVAAVLVAAAACSQPGAAPDDGPVLRIAVLQHGDVTDQVELVSSSALAVDLAVEQAIARGDLSPDSGLTFIETAGSDPDEVVDEASELAADPTVAAVVVTPFTDVPGAERAFTAAGVPVFSFSGLGGLPDDPMWRRLVPTTGSEAALLADLGGEEPCVAGTSPVAPPVTGPDLGGDPDTVPDRATVGGCSAVVWLGDADAALELSAELDGLPMLVSAGARTDRLPSEGFPDTVGTTAVVPCPTVDVSVDEDARRFIHAYQAGHGVPPGLCAAEGYGLGRWLVGAASRARIVAAMAETTEVPAPSRPLPMGSARVEPAIERVVGVRWIPTSN